MSRELYLTITRRSATLTPGNVILGCEPIEMPEITFLPPGSSTQRGGLNHQAIEDYLKTIYSLAEEESPVSTSRIAAARNVKPASVTGMLQRLEQLQLVNYEKHYGVTLTETGHKIALEVIRHHRLIELYLIEALGFSWDEVHEQADILEHVISEKLEERIAAALGYPTFDPHGDPIPNKEGQIAQTDARPLISIPPTQPRTVTLPGRPGPHPRSRNRGCSDRPVKRPHHLPSKRGRARDQPRRGRGCPRRPAKQQKRRVTATSWSLAFFDLTTGCWCIGVLVN